jgi:hypothetical protein
MRATILVLAISFPAVAAAQDTASTVREDAPAVTSAQAPGTRPPAARPPAERKRRASMVGYIADATIESQIRLRFDAGYHDDFPDRAEFFYGQCGCNGGGAPGPSGLATDLNFQQFSVDAQYAVTDRIAVFGTLPARFIQPQSFFAPAIAGSFGNQSGIGDVRAGVKAALLSRDDTTLTAQVQGHFPTGDSSKGLGTNHSSLEFALLLNQKVSDRLAVESQVGDWHPISGSTFKGSNYAGDVFFYGIGPSFELVNTGHVAFAPVVELVGWHVSGGLLVRTGSVVAADANIVNLKFGARTTIDNRSAIYVGYGRALTDAVWYSDILRIEYRYSF